MRIVVLGSGSSGNCTLIESGDTRILVDAGFGVRSLRRRCEEAGLSFEGMDGIVLTHGHSDHVRAVGQLVKHYPVPVYVNEGTREEVAELKNLDGCAIFSCGEPFAIGPIEVSAFPTPHDAAEPVGFCFESAGVRGLLATDLGEITPAIAKLCRACDWLVIESNHDEELLKVGPYPWMLKKRVLGSRGHLSNDALGKFFAEQYDGHAAHIFLAHLSRQNNLPDLAVETAVEALEQRLPLFSCQGPQVHLTHQNKPSIVVHL